MKVPFTKAHGARNDFLLTWERDAPRPGERPDRAALARAICDRHAGVGADGWILVSPADAEADGSIQIYNSDGSTAEISGNGTRCAAAFLVEHGHAGDVARIRTGAGVKTLRRLRSAGLEYEFEMDMGRPEVVAASFPLPLGAGSREVTLLRVGNPQCAVPVADFDFDWRAMGAEIESHPHFPDRTNVSFVRPLDERAIEVRFWERGAGETMSSGTGSTGAAAMAVLRGWATSPVRVLTPAGPLDIRLDESAYLTGPAVLIAEGVFLA
ncbi:MAG: diaminopimelate epimerase [Bryobacteraceae bacterium]|jgi:diaminopimelate epimerase